MWSPDDITCEVDPASEGAEVILTITTPIGVLQIMGEIVRLDREVLEIDRAHIGGLSPGACGRAGLNAIGRKLLELLDVKEITLQGSARTTGRKGPGHVPRRIRFPNGSRSAA
jgi:hypothetical protein